MTLLTSDDLTPEQVDAVLWAYATYQVPLSQVCSAERIRERVLNAINYPASLPVHRVPFETIDEWVRQDRNEMDALEMAADPDDNAALTAARERFAYWVAVMDYQYPVSLRPYHDYGALLW